jgi:hypothetical protein
LTAPNQGSELPLRYPEPPPPKLNLAGNCWRDVTAAKALVQAMLAA